MTAYNQIVARAGSGFDVGGANANVGDALVPEPLAQSIIQELPKQSAALSLCKKTILSTKTERMPVLDVLPLAYWVGGDTGLKQTTNQQWKNVTMVVEELATIVPIPLAYLDDAGFPIWDEVQPRMVEAAGNLIDQAVFWNIGKPSTWGTSIFGGANAAGNTVVNGFVDNGVTAATDFGQSVTALGDLMAQTGYSVNGFVGRPGLNWKLAGLRSAQGVPIYSSISQAFPMAGASALQGNLYGYPIAMPENGSWQPDSAQLLAGDFSKSIIGVRQDISFKMFDQGVISDNNGAVILNLMQQDAMAMRMVMRLAYATVNPVTIMQPGKGITTRWPFGAVLTSTTAGAGYTGTATTVSGSTALTALSAASAAANWVGLPITGTGIPAGTQVAAVVSSSAVTLSNPATAAGTGVAVTVGHQVGVSDARESITLVSGEGAIPSLDLSSSDQRAALRRALDEADAADAAGVIDNDGTGNRKRSSK